MYPAVYRDRAQERGGAHEDGRLVLGAHASECLDVGRVGAEHHGHAVKEGQDKREREPERMEKREQSRHHVGTAQFDDVVALERVRDYVLVREFYALGRAFRTGTEEDDRIVIQLCGSEPERPQNALGAGADNECGDEFPERRKFLFLIVQINYLALFCNVGKVCIPAAQFIQECVRGDYGRNFCLLDAAENRIDGGGIVQVDARLARAKNRDDSECGVAARREHEPDVLFALRDRLDGLAKVMAEADHVVAVHVVARGVDEYGAAAALAHRLEPEWNDGFGTIHRKIPYIAAEELQVFTDFLFGCICGERLGEPDAYHAVERLRAHYAFGCLAVAAAPEALDVERDYLRAGIFDGLAVVERELRNKRCLGNFAFGEDDHGFAVQECFADLFHGGCGVAAVNVYHVFAVHEPALVPVGKRVTVTREA